MAKNWLKRFFQNIQRGTYNFISKLTLNFRLQTNCKKTAFRYKILNSKQRNIPIRKSRIQLRSKSVNRNKIRLL